MSKVQLPAQLLKISSRADRTYKLEFNTRELSGHEAATLLGELMNEGWLLWSPNELSESDIPKEQADPLLETKSVSQRVRGSLFLLWKQQGERGDFDTFYKTRMERFNDQIKQNFN
jgi:hypothetical protein